MRQFGSVDVDEEVEEDVEFLPFKIDTFVPDDIFFMIFSFLSGQDLDSVKLCSKRFHYLAHLSGNAFHFNRNACRDPKVIEKIVTTLTNKEKSLLFRRVHIDYLHLTDDDILKISTMCQNLTELSIRYCAKLTNSACESMSKHCKKLVSLDIVGVGDISNIGMKFLSTLRLEFFSLSAVNQKKDKQLGNSEDSKKKVQKCVIYEFFSNGNMGRDLKKLRVSFTDFHNRHGNFVRINEDSFFQLFHDNCNNPSKCYPKLKSLVLDNYENRENDASFLDSLFPNLQSFSSFMDNPSNNFYFSSRHYNSNHHHQSKLSILKFLPHSKITNLRLPQLDNLESVESLLIFKSFTCLSSLVVSCPHNRYRINLIPPFRVENMLPSAKTLRKLEIRYWKINLDGKDLENLKEFKNIRHLEISFNQVKKSDFEENVLPYLHENAQNFDVLDINFPSEITPLHHPTSYDFSFVRKLIHCRTIGLKDIPDKNGANEVFQELVNHCGGREGTLKNLKILNLSGMKNVEKFMPDKIIVSFKRSLEELMIFRTGLDPRDFVQLRNKFPRIKMYFS